jgi:hypothetical protein
LSRSLRRLKYSTNNTAPTTYMMICQVSTIPPRVNVHYE